MVFVKQIIIERCDADGKRDFPDYVISEEKINFYLNGEKLLSAMSLPCDQDAHFVGFLLSEGVISDVSQIRAVGIFNEGKNVFLEADISEENRANLFREKTLTSGCCVGVTGNAEGELPCAALETDYRVPFAALTENIGRFLAHSELFAATGCVHKAALLLENGKELLSEDIGRHNAIDKAAGRARLEGNDISRSVLFVSGRLSSEMVYKCAMHRVPIVVSKAAVTMRGIEAAQERGVTLVGFAREGRVNIYAHAERIVI